jgi:elongation factor P--(R)-beta-lysine ligase
MSAPTPWWHPDAHADRRPALLARNRIKTRLRARFEAEGFIEVETPALQVSPGNEAHLHAFATDMKRVDGTLAQTLYLHTSPEFAMKKLLAAGETRIFTFAPVFRNRERGALHAPEFTMLEWYRVAEPYPQLMRDCTDIVARAAEAVEASILQYRGRSADPFGTPVRLTVADAFDRYAGIDLLATLPATASAAGEPDREHLAAQARAASVRVAVDDTWSDIFSRVLVERIEPRLGEGRMTILDEYPTCEAALARPCAHDPRVAERFELYACGVELANAFGELTDPAEQRRRFEAEMALKQAVYGERYPIDEEFLAALAIMPQSSGAALGFDRLVMLATHAPTIDHVQWAPVAES